MSLPALALEAYGLAFGARVVLVDVTFDVPMLGMLVLIGPAGAGKSALLRTLSGANDSNPSLRTWGRATFAGAPVGPGWGPALVAQNVTLLMGTVLDNLMASHPDRAALSPQHRRDAACRLLDGTGLEDLAGSLQRPVLDLPLGVQRRVAVIRTCAADPRLLCIDEPTSDLPDDEAERMIALLRREAERRAVLFVTHNQRHAIAAGGTTALLAGGRVHEIAPTAELFASPMSRAAQQFIRTGSCGEPSPGAKAEDLEEGVTVTPLPAVALAAVNKASGPRGFRWAKLGKLGGTPRPGIVDEIAYDLEALRRVGITLLVTLETDRFPEAMLAPFGLRGLFFPFKDMSAPTVDAALAHCAQIERLLAAGEVIALHCRAGLGRTGTMLVAQLIYEGSSALEALELARRIEPRWVQSAEQVEFLEQFARAVPRASSSLPATHGGPPA